ncbi:MAG: ribonuclease P protein component [Deltaproteobacteria bacterium]|nr:ribonuclease P protein component [Deltaproteobacteria bacterium]
MDDFGLPKANRIRKRSEYLRLQGIGSRNAKGRFVVITTARAAGGSRLGITASRKVGNAVVRNRIKRLVREFFRHHKQLIDPPRDVLVIARSSAATASLSDIEHELSAALEINVGK